MPNISTPIIVLGAARSGTKFLRDVLGASPGTAVVPFDVNYIWRTGNELYPSDALPACLCSDKIAMKISSEIFRNAGLKETGDSRRLVEKTVSNTLRVEFVARVFPDADFVHIIRDGRDVVSSSRRQWLAPTDWWYMLSKLKSFPLRNYRYALWYMRNMLNGVRRSQETPYIWGVRYEGIVEDIGERSIAEICARQWIESVLGVRNAIRARPDIRLHELHYEELVQSELTLSNLVEWLGLTEADAVIERYRQMVNRDSRCAWDSGMTREDASSVMELIQDLQSELGYA